jgi:hypothetical protein
MMPPAQQITRLEKDTKYISDTLLMQHHMGLGDHIHLVGLVRHAILDLGFKNVIVFCKSRNYETVKRLYSNDNEVQVISVGDPQNVTDEVNFVLKYISNMSQACVYFRLGYENYPWAQGSFIGYPSYVFYDMAKVSRNIRWSHFKFDRDIAEQTRVYKKLNPNDEPYIFVHDDIARGFEIPIESVNAVSSLPTDRLVIKNDMSENVLDFALLLENASEIHCMGSSIFCFADLLSLGDTKCFFHDIRSPSIFPVKKSLEEDTKNDWTWVGYP